MDHVYELRHDDIGQAAGGPMGSPVVMVDTWLHETEEGAKRGAQELLASEGRKEVIRWKGQGHTTKVSQDLGDRQYVITRRIVLP